MAKPMKMARQYLKALRIAESRCETNPIFDPVFEAKRLLRHCSFGAITHTDLGLTADEWVDIISWTL